MGYLTNESLMELQEIPEHLIILGAVTSGLNSGRCSAGLEAA